MPTGSTYQAIRVRAARRPTPAGPVSNGQSRSRRTQAHTIPTMAAAIQTSNTQPNQVGSRSRSVGTSRKISVGPRPYRRHMCGTQGAIRSTHAPSPTIAARSNGRWRRWMTR